MKASVINTELSVLISHYLRERNPEMFEVFSDYCRDHGLLPTGQTSMQQTLDILYKNLRPDHFLRFLKTLTPDDDYPSLFRRMSPFDLPKSPTYSLGLILYARIHERKIYTLEVDPLSRFLMSASNDSTIKLLSCPDLSEICTLTGHKDKVSTASIHPCVSYVLSSSLDGTLRLFSLNTLKSIATVSGESGQFIHHSGFSPDGQYFAGGCEDGYVYLWRLRSVVDGQLAPYKRFGDGSSGAVTWIGFSPGSEFLAFAAEPNHVKVVCLSTGRLFDLQQHSYPVTFVTFSRRLYAGPLGMAPKLLTFARDEGTVVMWRIEEDGFCPKVIFKNQGMGRKSNGLVWAVWDTLDHLILILKKNGVVVKQE
jgi:WD40 repeat protein